MGQQDSTGRIRSTHPPHLLQDAWVEGPVSLQCATPGRERREASSVRNKRLRQLHVLLSKWLKEERVGRKSTERAKWHSHSKRK